MSKNNIFFILHKPQLSENIGACARAIKNFNFKKLILINPKPIFPNDKILATSVGAKDIITQSKKYDTLEQALGNIDIVIATSARFRNKNIKHINLKDLEKINFKKKLVFYLVLRHQVYLMKRLVMLITPYRYQLTLILNLLTCLIV